jgi:putative ABC transport system substrate-binding protein
MSVGAKRAAVAGMAIILLVGESLAALAQTAPSPRIGFLSPASASTIADRLGAFRQGLSDHGYIEGRNIVVEYRFAEGDRRRLSELAVELVGLKLDVIVATAQPAPDEVRKLTARTPIVFAVVGDAVAEGLVETLGSPAGNMTGLMAMGPEVIVKQLELFKEAVPSLRRVALLYDPTHAGHGPIVRKAMGIAQKLGLQVLAFGVDGPNVLGEAFDKIKTQRVDGLLVLRGGLFVHLRQRIAEIAVAAGLPAMFGHAEEADAGALMAFGPDAPALYRGAAAYVDKILKGAAPASLPVQQPTQFELVVNLRTARALGVEIPAAVLARADRVIE